MHRKLVCVLLILSAGFVWAQGVHTSNSSVRSRLHDMDDDESVITDSVSQQEQNRSNPLRPALSFAFTSFRFPGAISTIAFGINNQGLIAGGYRILPAPRHAALIDNGQFIPLAPSSILGSHFSDAFDINDRGDVVGIYRDDQGVDHGFLLSNNVLTTIDFPGSTATDAFSINASGVIVGDFLDTTGVFHGFVLRDGAFMEIDVPGALDTEPTRINASGEIVGAWDTASDVQGHGFLLTQQGQFITIDDPKAPPESTSAFGINDHGQIVGGYTDAIGNLHCFLLSAGTFTDVDFPGAPFTQCVGINNKGVIAGGFFVDGTPTAYEATPTHR